MTRRRTMKTLILIGLLAGGTTLSACANMTHLTRTRTMGKEDQYGRRQVFFIDAKQRAIFQRQGVVCAEPSPDALSALAASQGLSVSTPEGTSVGQSLSIAEAAGAIGLRTQSIQLMRDHMYRVCEGYLSGAVSGITFQLMHRRFQTTVVGILAIEQLTGAIRAPSIVLGGSAQVGNAEAVAQLTTLRESTAKSVTEAETALATAEEAEEKAMTELAAAEAALQAAPDDAAKKTARDEKKAKAEEATAARLEADGTAASRKAALSAIDRQLILARSSGSATASGAIESLGSRSHADMAAVALAVSKIVDGTMSLPNRDDFCVAVLAEAAVKHGAVEPNNAVAQECLALLRKEGLRSAGVKN
jgi:hypothetical protein